MRITGYPILEEVAEQTEVLLKAAGIETIDPRHAREYALLAASARDKVQWEMQHPVESSYYLAYGYPFGLGRKGYEDHGEVKRRYRRSREAAQKIQATLTRSTTALENLTAILKGRQDDLPKGMLPDMCPNAEALKGLCASVQGTLTAYLSVDALARDLKSAKKWNITAEQLALVWWEKYGPTARGKWKERLTLANAWGLSDASSEDSLRRMVTRLTKTVTVSKLPPWIAP